MTNRILLLILLIVGNIAKAETLIHCPRLIDGLNDHVLETMTIKVTGNKMSPHGDNWKEFGYMVETGMPAMETIQSATIEASKLLGIEDKLGSLEAGKLADIVAVSGNPLVDISIMSQMQFVMKDGVVYKRAR